MLPPTNIVGVFLMLPYDYGRRLFDAMITKYSRHYFDAISHDRRFLTLFL